MKKLVFILSAMLLLIGTMDVQAQWGKKLLKKAGESAKRATERNVERKVEQTVDKAFEGAEDVVTGKGNNNNEKEEPPTSTNSQGNFETMDDGEDVAQQEQQQPQQSLEMTYAKSDFVPGDEIIFEDDVTREQIGEFPSQWDLLKGTVEIAQINGDKVILCVSQDDPVIAPLFDNMKSYLPEKFTLEFDFWVGPFTKKGDDEPENCYIVRFYKPESGSRVQTINLDDWYYSASDHRTRLRWDFIPSSGENSRSGSDDSFRTIPNSWNHFSLSFNQRAMKVYINGIRYANIPNTVAPGHFDIQFYRGGGYFTNNTSIRNIRVAKGAVPLYDRMMSDGKFITYDITFDVGKSTIKPESMGEINRIVKLMTDNPDLRFSVEGHTDSTGNEASNQTLSEARSNAIVGKLVELGISADRLSASGKGQSSPIADNGTDEGRAKNRRVEFVKM